MMLAIPDEPAFPHLIVGYPQWKGASERGLVTCQSDASGDAGSYGGCDELRLSERGVVNPQMRRGGWALSGSHSIW